MISPHVSGLDVTGDVRVARDRDGCLGGRLQKRFADIGQIAILITGVSDPNLGTSIICVCKDEFFIRLLQLLLIRVHRL